MIFFRIWLGDHIQHLKLSLTEVRQVMPTSHLTVTIDLLAERLMDYGHLHQYSRWNMQRTHIIMNFSKVGLLKIPFSGPDMWDFAKSYHIRKFSQISFKWAMVSSISLTIDKYFSQSFLKQELYRSNLFKTTKLMISIPCIVILI